MFPGRYAGARAEVAPPVPPASFDFYISPTGSDTNLGTLASPWALTALNTKWSTYGGKKVGIIAGTYDLLTLAGGSYNTGSNDYELAAFEIQGGTSGSPTYIASCDANGNYSPRSAILDGGLSLTVDAQVIGQISGTAFTVDSVTSGTVKVGDVVFWGSSTSMCWIVSGSGTSWTLNQAPSEGAISALGSLVWNSGTVTATLTGTQSIQNPTLSVGGTFTVVISGTTPSAYNGTYTATLTFAGSSSAPATFTFPLATNPGTATAPGSFGQPMTLYYAVQNPYGKALIGHNGVSGQTVGYVTIDGLEVKNGFLQLINIGRAAGIGLDNIPGIVIKNNYVHGCYFGWQGGDNPGALLVQNMDGGLIQNNYITDVVYDNYQRSNGCQCYWSKNTVMEYNTVVQTDATMVGSMSFKDTPQSNNTIRYSFLYMPLGTASGGPGSDNDSGYFSIHNNISVAAGVSIAWIGGQPSPEPSVDTQNWYNNTFLGPVGTAWQNGLWRESSADSFSHYNNIYQRSSNANGLRGDFTVTATGLYVSDYNIFPSDGHATLCNGASEYGGTVIAGGTTLAAWQSALAANASQCIGQDAHSAFVTDSTYYGGTAAIFVGGPATDPASYKIIAGAPGSASGAIPGSSNGQSSGAAIDMGAWGGTDVNTGKPVAQIGCNFTP